MTENELINKIKELKQISPNQGWVVLTKNQILDKEIYRGLTPVNFSVFFQKPVFAVATAVMLLVGAAAGFFYLTERQNKNEMAEIPAETEQAEQAEMVVLNLEELQNEANQVTEALKKIKGPQNVLEARHIVIPTIEAVRNMIAEVEMEQNIKPKQTQVLTMKIDEMESALNEAIAIAAKSLIQDLEIRTLTEVQQEILEKAKQAYKQGNYTEALINGLFVSQLGQSIQ